MSQKKQKYADSALKTGIHPNTLRFYDLPKEAQIKNKSTADLLNAKRLDVIIRYIYAKAKIDGYGESWAKRAYTNLIKSQTGNFSGEHIDPGKSNIDDYHMQFDELIKSMMQHGFKSKNSIVPTCKDTIVDGAHRLAIALALNIKNIDTVELEGSEQIISFNDLKKFGLDDVVAREAAREYVHLKENTRCAVFFPVSSNAHKETRDILSKSFEIDFEHKAALSFNGTIRLVNFLYGHHNWWNYRSAHDFARKRFKSGLDTKFIFYQEDKDIRPIKEKMREHHSSENHALHTTDTHEETTHLADMVFNDNALFWLNNGLNIKTPIFEKHLLEYVSLAGQTPERFCIDTGGVLALHGLRDATDLDYLSVKNKPLPKTEADIFMHKGEYEEIGLSSEDIITNPKHHFRINGLKYVSLDAISTLKKHRKKCKDVHDLSLIRYLKHKDNLVISVKWNQLKSKIHHGLYLSLHKSFAFLVNILRTVLPYKIFATLRSFYQMIKSSFLK